MNTWKYAGRGTSSAFLKDVKGMIVSTKNTTQTVAAAKTLTGWTAIIAPATTALIKGIYIDLARGFEPTTTAPEMTTSNTGFVEKTKDFAPMFNAYGFLSYADYQTWFAADGNEFDITLVMQDGKLQSAATSAGLQKGFTSRIFMTYDLSKSGGDGKQKAHAFTVVFDCFDEFKDHIIIDADFTLCELKALNPVGLNVEIVTAYDGSGDVVLKVTNRITGTPYTALDAITNLEVVSLSADIGGACTVIGVTQAALGIYTFTILETAAVLTGDFEIQIVDFTATPTVSHLSNVLNIPV